MPTYYNSTATVITVGSVRVEPYATVATEYTIETLPTGLTKTLDTPYASNNIIVSEIYTQDSNDLATITLPAGTYQYTLDIRCSAGQVDVFYSSELNTPGRLLITDDIFQQLLTTEKVRVILLRFLDPSSIVRVNITKG